jgi:hypothetical protein
MAAGTDPVPTATPTPGPAATVATNLQDTREPVAVDEGIVVSAQHGTLERAVVRAAGERLRGPVTDQGTTWRAAERAGAALPGASLWAM